MSLITKLKQKYDSHLEYVFKEQLLKEHSQIRSERLMEHTMHSTESGVTDHEYFEGKKIVVSLTTYEKRIDEVYLTVESLMEQTMKPNRIILWLSDGISEDDVPLTLRRQEKRGLEIRFCKDIRSYKKLIPTLKICSDDIIITTDDDVMYNIDLVEMLVRSYKKNPNCVHCNVARRITLDGSGGFTPYSSWPHVSENEFCSADVCPIGIGGVLYPPHIFPEEVLDENSFMDICRFGDDLWFKAMALKNGVRAQTTILDSHANPFLPNFLYKDKCLAVENIGGRNDKQIRALDDKYGLRKLLIR